MKRIAIPLNSIDSEPENWNLHSSTQTLSYLFNFVDDAIFWIKDRNGTYRSANRAMLIIFGYSSPKEVIGKTDFDFLPNYIATQFRIDDEKVLEGQPIKSRIELIGRTDQDTRWCITNKLPLKSSNDGIIGTVGIAKLITNGHAIEGIEASEALSNAIHYSRGHHTNPPNNAELAKVAGLSQRVFERHFRAYFRESPQKYLRRLRIHQP